ncbi:MAG: hypothetical protein ACHREM_12610 [Polyangiales bacterium]
MIVSVRVRPFVGGKATEGRATSAPYAAIVGTLLGHRFERFDLDDQEVATLRAAACFDIKEGDSAATRPKGEIIKLVQRWPKGRIVKLSGPPSGDAA